MRTTSPPRRCLVRERAGGDRFLFARGVDGDACFEFRRLRRQHKQPRLLPRISAGDLEPLAGGSSGDWEFGSQPHGCGSRPGGAVEDNLSELRGVLAVDDPPGPEERTLESLAVVVVERQAEPAAAEKPGRNRLQLRPGHRPLEHPDTVGKHRHGNPDAFEERLLLVFFAGETVSSHDWTVRRVADKVAVFVGIVSALRTVHVRIEGELAAVVLPPVLVGVRRAVDVVGHLETEVESFLVPEHTERAGQIGRPVPDTARLLFLVERHGRHVLPLIRLAVDDRRLFGAHDVVDAVDGLIEDWRDLFHLESPAFKFCTHCDTCCHARGDNQCGTLLCVKPCDMPPVKGINPGKASNIRPVERPGKCGLSPGSM